MTITVQYWAQLRDAAGTTTERISLEKPCSIRELVVQLAASHGEQFRSLVLDKDGGPRPSIAVLVGDQMVRCNDPRLLQDGDAVALLSPIAGG
ncbi:MAG: MoaD/ThiS family protein [Planctomycetota bacterium]|nr:MoaD/ThiS family protein [Planctomycetota bacterium]